MFGIFKKEKPQKKDAIKDQLNAIKAEIREVEYALELLADEEVYDLDDMLIDEKYKGLSKIGLVKEKEKLKKQYVALQQGS